MIVKTCTPDVEPEIDLAKEERIVKIVTCKDEKNTVFTITECRKGDCTLIKKGNVELWIKK